jgi:hypothetical protein
VRGCQLDQARAGYLARPRQASGGRTGIQAFSTQRSWTVFQHAERGRARKGVVHGRLRCTGRGRNWNDEQLTKGTVAFCSFRSAGQKTMRARAQGLHIGVFGVASAGARPRRDLWPAHAMPVWHHRGAEPAVQVTHLVQEVRTDDCVRENPTMMPAAGMYI